MTNQVTQTIVTTMPATFFQLDHARWQIQLWKNLNFWLKVDALNFTNESTLTTYQTTGSVDNSGTIPQWQPSTNFGRVRNDLDYQVPRTWLFTIGLQF